MASTITSGQGRNANDIAPEAREVPTMDAKARMYADRQRRKARKADELIELAEKFYSDAPDNYHVTRGITGEPSEKNRVYRASDNNWNRGMSNPRLAGTGNADITKIDPARVNTVRVTRNGRTTIESSRSFRKGTTNVAGVKAPKIARDRALAAKIGSIHN